MEQETKTCPYCGEEILAVAKKCKHCGEWLNNDEEPKEEKVMIPCPICGEMIEESTTKCPHCNESLEGEVIQGPIKEVVPKIQEDKSRSFFDYYFVEPFIKHYFKFKGRINRKHFWVSLLLWFAISALIISVFFINLSQDVSETVGNTMGGIMAVWFLGSAIPFWATVLRRMRDGDSEIGLWGWWFYILPLPYMIFIVANKLPIWLCIIPFVILLWWLVKPSDNIMRDDGLLPDEQPKVTFKKSDIITLCVIIILSASLILYGHLSSENNNSIEEVQIVNQTEDVNQTIESNNPQNFKEAYLKLLSDYSQEFDDGMGICYYFLFDITGDGIPELWIISGTCEADYRLSVYTYDKELLIIDEGEEGNASHSGFYRGEGYILQVSGHMGYQAWCKITYSNGKLKYDVIFEENLNEMGKEDYTEVSEPAVDSYPSDDAEPIVKIFNRF